MFTFRDVESGNEVIVPSLEDERTVSGDGD